MLISCTSFAYIVEKQTIDHVSLIDNSNIEESQLLNIIPERLESYQNEHTLLKPHNLVKRAVVFRPLFVYRQQQISKKRLHDEQQQQQDYNANVAKREEQQNSQCNCNNINNN